MHILIAVVVLAALVYWFSKTLQARGASGGEVHDAAPAHAGNDMPGLDVAFVSGGKLFYKAENGGVSQLHSPYVQEITDRTERQKERHAWKQNTSFEISAYGGRKQFEPDGVRIMATSAQFDRNNSLIYCLKDEGFGGLFSYDFETKVEKRLLHKQHLSLADLNLDAARGKLLCSTSSNSGVANIAMLDSDGSNFRELTGGDTFDSAPAWIPGEDDEILYQSAGLAREHGWLPGRPGQCHDPVTGHEVRQRHAHHGRCALRLSAAACLPRWQPAFHPPAFRKHRSTGRTS